MLAGVQSARKAGLHLEAELPADRDSCRGLVGDYGVRGGENVQRVHRSSSLIRAIMLHNGVSLLLGDATQLLTERQHYLNVHACHHRQRGSIVTQSPSSDHGHSCGQRRTHMSTWLPRGRRQSCCRHVLSPTLHLCCKAQRYLR